MKNSYSTDFVKKLRQKPTDAEALLWLKLREMQPAGIRFRRQHPLGKYIVDFACIQANLIIEVDGSQHAEKKNIEYDAKRTAWLEEQGFRVLRFWDNDILKYTDAIASQIFEDIKVCNPHPRPLP